MAINIELGAKEPLVLVPGLKYVWTRIVGPAWSGLGRDDEVEKVVGAPNALPPPAPPPPPPSNSGSETSDSDSFDSSGSDAGSSDSDSSDFGDFGDLASLDLNNDRGERHEENHEESQEESRSDAQTSSPTHAQTSFFLSCSLEQEEEGEHLLWGHIDRARGKQWRRRSMVRPTPRRRHTKAHRPSEHSSSGVPNNTRFSRG